MYVMASRQKKTHKGICPFFIITFKDQIARARPGGRGGTPLYGLYRYVPWDRVWFFEVLDP